MKYEILSKDVCVLTPTSDRVTAANATEFKEEVVKLIDAGHARLILDMSAISFIDSSGLGALVGILKRLGNRGDFIVYGLSASLKQMFSITRMDRVFSAYPDRATAIAAMAENI